MRSLKKFALLTVTTLMLFISCKKEGTANLELRLNDLPTSVELYEGWLIVDGKPISIGQFTPEEVNYDEDGVLSFDVDKKTLKNATAFKITIEKSSELHYGPENVEFLAGEFDGNTVELTTNHPDGIGMDLSAVGGTFFIGTPTDNSLETDSVSGIWFYDNPNLPYPSLNLPELNNNWTYEAYAYNCGLFLDIGKFEKARGADDRNTYGDYAFVPGFPGEDFIRSTDIDINSYYHFPVNMRYMNVVIAVAIKNGDALQRTIPILTAEIPENAQPNDIINLSAKPATDFKYGTVRRN